MLTLFSDHEVAAGAVVTIGEGETHHARVRRVALGEQVRLVNGRGDVGVGQVIKLARTQLHVELNRAWSEPPLPEIHLLVPVADRDRMLWLAEKAVELGVSSWRPVLWRRSRDVRPRGEGRSFQDRVRSRMIGALTQSGGAWLPVHHPDATPERALAAGPAGARLLLDVEGAPMLGELGSAPVTLAVGPEGGLEPAERTMMCDAGFRPVRLGPLTLRFETAGVAALAVARAALTDVREGDNGS
ncbi:MAG TPA: RsmE family RNA methyltransferase [Gemmatimonadaceae bacterium]|nr:RsmE family RNA methyltransferase [Gemmatimonadaceae bacterium]